MTATIRMFAVTLSLGLATQAVAAELSPWLGSSDQTPYQLDPHTMVTVTFAADPLQTGSISTAPCPPSGCASAPQAATSSNTAGGVPQN